MSLYTKLVMVTVLPFVVFAAFGMFRIQDVINRYEDALHHNYEIKAAAVEKSIQRIISQMDTAAAVLSTSEEISKALQKADNNVLFDISNRFIDPISSIVFTDENGMVVSRAPDEYRFGDNISDAAYFRKAIRNESYLGVAGVDGTDAIVMARPIRQYDDIPVGAVCVGIAITGDLLKSFSDDPNIVVEMIVKGVTLSRSGANEKPVYSRLLKGIISNDPESSIDVNVHFDEDKYYAGLLMIRKSLSLVSLSSVILLIFVLIFFLNRQFKPYSMIVGSILNYANQEIDGESLKKDLAGIRQTSDDGGRKIVNALIQMLDVIEANFRKIREYNDELDRANRKLEKSLNDVKQISGLLPICSACKKIRDDKGYWKQVEHYIHEHSEATFSHSMCPECSDRFYGQEDWYIKMKEKQKNKTGKQSR